MSDLSALYVEVPALRRQEWALSRLRRFILLRAIRPDTLVDRAIVSAVRDLQREGRGLVAAYELRVIAGVGR